MQTGYTVPPHYDSLVAKLIVHGPNRNEALAIMQRALDEIVIEGIPTTIPMLRRIFRDRDFLEARVDTTWVERVLMPPKNRPARGIRGRAMRSISRLRNWLLMGPGSPHPAVPATFSRGEKGRVTPAPLMAVGNSRGHLKLDPLGPISRRPSFMTSPNPRSPRQGPVLSRAILVTMRRLLALMLVVGLAPSLLPADEAGVSPRVLFLGDKGHHRPAERAAQLIPVLASRGIEVDLHRGHRLDLNPETLAKYDALIVYANIDEIAPEQEKALLDYVAGGGGFVPLHCASYCFLNSPEYIELVGAQFRSHGTGEFDTKVVDADHPIMKGLEPFHSWDETYVHTSTTRRTARCSRCAPRASARSRGRGSARTARAASSTPPGATTSGPGATPASTTWSSAASAGRRTRERSSTAGRGWRPG